MKKIISVILTLIIVVTAFSACTSKNVSEETTENPIRERSLSIKIVTTIFPEYDWVRQITGTTDNVSYLEKNGTDLHSFEPTSNDIVSLSEADIFIYVGGTSDKWVDKTVKAAKNSDLVTISLMDVAGGLEEETVQGMQSEEEDEDVSEMDEHIWLSLKKAQKCVKAISDAIIKADPNNAELYRTNTEDYLSRLSELDKQYTDMVSTATRDTILVADRFPFRYLVEDYNIKYFAAFAGCSSESEASFETITYLINKTKELNLPYIFTLENSGITISDTISSDTGASVLTLNSCQSVTEEDILNNTTYLGIMFLNLEALREALN